MYTIKSRIWFEGESGAFLASGRVDLLRKIEQFGSISKAAKDMKMSYKKAWGLIDSINSQSEKPIVEKQSGGVNGGGTIVTDEGKRMIKSFEIISQKCEDFLNKELEKGDYI